MSSKASLTALVREHLEIATRVSDLAWEGSAGDLLVVPPERHGLSALEDSAVLLTVGAHRRRDAESAPTGTTPHS